MRRGLPEAGSAHVCVSVPRTTTGALGAPVLRLGRPSCGAAERAPPALPPSCPVTPAGLSPHSVDKPVSRTRHPSQQGDPDRCAYEMGSLPASPPARAFLPPARSRRRLRASCRNPRISANRHRISGMAEGHAPRLRMHRPGNSSCLVETGRQAATATLKRARALWIDLWKTRIVRHAGPSSAADSIRGVRQWQDLSPAGPRSHEKSGRRPRRRPESHGRGRPGQPTHQ